MSNSTSLLDLIATNQASKEVTANALFDAASAATLWGRRASTCAGLTWGYYGGWFNGQINNGTIALTASATNYLMADASTGAVSVNTTGFTAGKIPLYSVVAGATTVTSYTDRRAYAPQTSSSSGVTSVNGQTGAVSLSTDNISQGATNLYFSNALARGALSVTGSLSYNSTTGVFSFTDAVTSVAGRTGAITLSTSDVSGLGTAAALDADTDATLAANSDTRLATQKAVKAYVATIAGGLTTGVSSVNGKTGVVSLSTTDISEGTNQYFTQARARAALSATGSISYNSTTGVISYTTPTTDGITEGTTNLYFTTARASAAAPVQSVAGRTGAVVLSTSDVSGLGTVATLALDTDTTLAANSDTRVATQKATKAYVDGKTSSQPFDVTAFYPGVPTASAKVLRVPVARAVSFAANFSGSVGKSSTNATSSTAFDVQKNGSSIGTITFAGGASSATFATSGGASQSLAAGDVLSIIAPATPDATLADVGIVLAGTR